MPNKRTIVRTKSTPDSIKEVSLKAVTFAELWTAYPQVAPYVDPKTGDIPPGFENQCAIRMSVTLHRVGIEMKSFRGKGQIRLGIDICPSDIRMLLGLILLIPVPPVLFGVLGFLLCARVDRVTVLAAALAGAVLAHWAVVFTVTRIIAL